MGLVEFAKRVIEGPSERRATLQNPNDAMRESLGVTSSYTGERVTVASAMELAAVRSAIAMISEAVGGLPLKVYRIQDDDSRIEARTHRMWKILHDKPNEHCTARSFWTATVAQLLIYENAFIYKERDPATDEVESLYHLDPTLVKVEMNGPAEKRFVVEGPPRRVYTVDEVLHIVGFSLDGYYGTSRITQARQTLGAAQARAKFEGGFFKRGARNSAWAGHPGRLGEKGIANVVKQLQVWHGGVENMHKIPVLEEGMSLNGIGQSMEDMQFAQMAEQTRTEIAVLFNIPPAYLGAKSGDSLTYATTESNQIQFAQMAVLPIADTIAKALSSDPGLLPWNVMFAEFTLESLIRADAKTRAEVWKIYKDMGVVDEAYIASRENLPKPPAAKLQPAVPGLPPDPTQVPAMLEQQAKLRALNP